MAVDKRDVLLPITNSGRTLIAVSALFSFMVILFVGLRMVRNFRFRKFGWDEALILFAMLVQLATCALMIASVVYGNGRHIYEFADWRESFLAIQLPWASQAIVTMALMFAKISLGITLLHIGLGRAFNSIIVVAVAVVSLADIWSLVMIVAGCRPSRNGAAGPCGASQAARASSYFQCAANIIIDIMFFAAPEYFLRKTKLSARDRMVVRIILSFMFLATIMSVIKLIYLQILLDKGDISWHSVPVSAAAVAESGLAIMAACLPALRQLAGQRFPKRLAFWKTATSRSSVTYDPRAARQPGASPKPDLEQDSFDTDQDGAELAAFESSERDGHFRYDPVADEGRSTNAVSYDKKGSFTSSGRYVSSKVGPKNFSLRPESQEPILRSADDDKIMTGGSFNRSSFPAAYFPQGDRSVANNQSNSQSGSSGELAGTRPSTVRPFRSAESNNHTVITANPPMRSSTILDKGEGFIPLYYHDDSNNKTNNAGATSNSREVYQHF